MSLEDARTRVEEALFARREALNAEILRFRAQVAEYADYADQDLLANYLKDCQQAQKYLHDLNMLAAGINHDEILLRFQRTHYPGIHNLLVEVDPYIKLFSLALKWQRSERRWMDGPLVDLNPDAVEVRWCHCCGSSRKLAAFVLVRASLFRMILSIALRLSWRTFGRMR